LNIVRTVLERLGTVEVAVPFARAAQNAVLGDAYLTLNASLTVEAAETMRGRCMVPLTLQGGRTTQRASM